MKMHRSIIKFLGQSLSLLCVLSVLCVSITGQEWKTVHDGVEYAQIIHKLGTEPVKINLLRLDLRKVRLDVHHAMDAAIGTEKTSSIAIRYAAVAAINAGFFRLDNSIWAGDSVGLLMSQSKLISEPTTSRTALVLYNGPETTEAAFHRFGYQGFLKYGNNKTIPILGTNRERGVNDVVLFTPDFHRTTLTSGAGLEIKVAKDKVIEIGKLMSNANIPENGFCAVSDRKISSRAVEIEEKSASGPSFKSDPNRRRANPVTDQLCRTRRRWRSATYQKRQDRHHVGTGES
jgi:hypothetical protein